MLKGKFIVSVAVAVMLVCCTLALCSCKKEPQNIVRDSVAKDSVFERVSFGKKYYFIGYDDYTDKEYYIFNDDGSASYNHIMEQNGKVTFHQVINYKWTYAGEGNCILLHNGTQMVVGKQDDAVGFCRVMHTSKDVAYWSGSGENTYFVCEDFVDQIPNYAQFVTGK